MKKIALTVLSFALVALGQPAWCALCGVIASVGGFALFWRVLLDYSSFKQRFWIATGWFTAVQLVQLSWFLSHPYLYIYPVYFALSLLAGMQFGGLAYFIQPRYFSKIGTLLIIPAIWVIMEWSRLFFLAGFSWNPVGMELTANLFSLQLASLGGIFFLSFWVFLTNSWMLHLWISPWKVSKVIGAIALILFPYLYGAIQLSFHLPRLEAKRRESNGELTALLVQPVFFPEEALSPEFKRDFVSYVLEEWREIISILAPYRNYAIDLIALPECVVPYGTYTEVYPFSKMQALFEEAFGSKVSSFFPFLELPFAEQSANSSEWKVNNAFAMQTIANLFHTPLIAGLEDAEYVADGECAHYSGALFFQTGIFETDQPFKRYSKRVLVPMGEYIPFSFCKQLAAQYGVQGSFTPGEKPLILEAKVPFSPCICYEETFGNMMRESRLMGAELLVNLTSDVWYPNSLLPQQHADHARLRTVENGFPLIRACNNGLTSAYDSLGRMVAILGETPDQQQTSPGALLVTIPTYTYHTLYSRVGDQLIVGLSLSILFIALLQSRSRSKPQRPGPQQTK